MTNDETSADEVTGDEANGGLADNRQLRGAGATDDRAAGAQPAGDEQSTPPQNGDSSDGGKKLILGRGIFSRMTLFYVGVVVVMAVVCGGLISILFLRDNTPELTQRTLQEAEALWNADGPTSYDMTLELGGARPGVVEVQVRGGQVVSMRRDGRTPSRRDTWDVWSVPGQFETLARNLEIAADPVDQINASPDTRWLLRAEFDPEFGYPRRYRQLIIGTGPVVSWDVRSFREVVE